MKRILMLSAAAALLAGAGAAWSAAGGDGPQQDRLAGGGTFGPGCSDGSVPFCPPRSREFSIDAASNPQGHGAYGTFRYGVPDTGSTLVVGRITCLAVDGTSAVAGGFIAGGNAAATSDVFFVYMQDRGFVGSPARDRSSATFINLASDATVPAGFPNECPPVDNNAFATGYFDVSAGDVQITDAN